MPDIFNASKQSSTNQTTPVSSQSTTQQNAASPPAKVSVNAVQKQSILDIPQTAMNLFSTLSLNPTGVSFANQDPGDDVVLFFRADFITNVPWIVTSIVFLFIPILYSMFGPLIGLPLVLLTPQITFVILYFYYLLLVGYVLVSFMYWFYNVGIVSKKRVIDIDFSDITYKNIVTVTLSEISDVNYTQQGFLQSFFDFGNVLIKSQGSDIAVEFLRIPQPGNIANDILELRGEVQGS